MQKKSGEKAKSASLMVVRRSGESASCLKERRIERERKIRKIRDYSTGQGIFSTHCSRLSTFWCVSSKEISHCFGQPGEQLLLAAANEWDKGQH